jgi:hypothetical protein
MQCDAGHRRFGELLGRGNESLDDTGLQAEVGRADRTSPPYQNCWLAYRNEKVGRCPRHRVCGETPTPEDARTPVPIEDAGHPCGI